MSGASPTMAVGTTSANIAAAITRLRPTTSAKVPVNGAIRATAKVEAVMARLVSPAPAPNSRASSGSTDCGAYRLRNTEKPARATATRRRSELIGLAGSVRHQHRQLRAGKNVPGGAAENHLAQPALRIGALDQKITTERIGFDEQCLAGAAFLRCHGEHGHAARAPKQRHRERGRTRLLGAAVPGDEHVLPEPLRRRGRRNEHRTAAFEQRRLERHHARALRLVAGPAEHGEVEHAAVAADEIVAVGRSIEPAE